MATPLTQRGNRALFSTEAHGFVWIEELIELMGRDKKAVGSLTFILDGPDGPEVVRPECAMPSTTRYDTTTAGTMFGLASRAYAIVAGRDYVTPEDVKAVAEPVLAHRITVKPEMWMSDITGHTIVEAVLGTVPAPSALEPAGDEG